MCVTLSFHQLEFIIKTIDRNQQAQEGGGHMTYVKRILVILGLYAYYTVALYILMNLPFGHMGKEFFGPCYPIFYSEILLYLLVSTRFIRTFYVYAMNRKWTEPAGDLISETELGQMHLPMKAVCMIGRKISCFTMKVVLFYEVYGYNWYVSTELLKKNVDRKLLVYHIWLQSQERYQSFYEILWAMNWPMACVEWICSKASWSKMKCSHWGLAPFYLLFKIFEISMHRYNHSFYEQLEMIHGGQLQRIHDFLIEEGYSPEDIVSILQQAVDVELEDPISVVVEAKRACLRKEINRLQSLSM